MIIAGDTVPASAPSIATPPPMPKAAVKAEVRKLMPMSRSAMAGEMPAGRMVSSMGTTREEAWSALLQRLATEDKAPPDHGSRLRAPDHGNQVTALYFTGSG